MNVYNLEVRRSFSKTMKAEIMEDFYMFILVVKNRKGNILNSVEDKLQTKENTFNQGNTTTIGCVFNALRTAKN